MRFAQGSMNAAADIIEDFPAELAAETPEQGPPGYNQNAVKQLRATPRHRESYPRQNS